MRTKYIVSSVLNKRDPTEKIVAYFNMLRGVWAESSEEAKSKVYLEFECTHRLDGYSWDFVQAVKEGGLLYAD